MPTRPRENDCRERSEFVQSVRYLKKKSENIQLKKIINAISMKLIYLFEEFDTHQLCEAHLAKPNTMGWSLPLGDLGPVEQIRDQTFHVYDA
jgi:hypothetical protein